MDDTEYRKALKKLWKLLETDELKSAQSYPSIKALAEAIEKYEELNFPIGLPTAAEAISFRMEQMKYSRADLAKLLGSRPRASEYLSGTRKPSKRDAIKIHDEWGVPLKILIQ